MLLTFGNGGIRCHWHAVSFCIALLLHSAVAAKYGTSTQIAEGDTCQMASGPGICTLVSKCTAIERAVIDKELSVNEIVHCGYSTHEEIICCPTQKREIPTTPPIADRFIFDSSIAPTNQVKPSRQMERPAVQACRRIEEGLSPSLTPHILGGTPVELGEYPHMAAIGFTSSINDNNEGPYDFNCGGTLIDKRFVLTAAHCVNKRNVRPRIVRLGVVNFTDPVQMEHAVEIPIRTVHIHPQYGGASVYNDIALLELERDVQFTSDVYPTCLTTELDDPPLDAILYVTGWGTINLRTRQQSDILLKARLNLVPIDTCNVTYMEEGSLRRLADGIVDTQLCAYDPGLTRDACQGDSGGPLNWVVDESLKRYRVAGIVSVGFSCASRIPSLYTKIASYLDYIENIVWP